MFVNIGNAIAAYARQIQHLPSRFDAYVKAFVEEGQVAKNILTADETAGLRVFIGKANCTQCHNGPLFTNDEFNCHSRWSDAKPGACKELDFMIADGYQLERAFKAPSLRNVAARAPYMHAGQSELSRTCWRITTTRPQRPPDTQS